LTKVPEAPPQGAVTVFYDGACPLCRREIDLYRAQSGAEALDFVDVSAAAPGALPPETSSAQLLSRLHVADSAGRLWVGAAAFFPGELFRSWFGGADVGLWAFLSARVRV